MPRLLPLGPEKMLEQAKQNGFVVPLSNYKVKVIGASPVGLTPEQWIAVKRFWEMYSAAAGAELVSYSTDCD